MIKNKPLRKPKQQLETIPIAALPIDTPLTHPEPINQARNMGASRLVRADGNPIQVYVVNPVRIKKIRTPWTHETIAELVADLYQYVIDHPDCITWAEVVVGVGVSRKTMKDQANEWDELSQCLLDLEETLVARLASNGAFGIITTKIASLALHQHGWRSADSALPGAGEAQRQISLDERVVAALSKALDRLEKVKSERPGEEVIEAESGGNSAIQALIEHKDDPDLW